MSRVSSDWTIRIVRYSYLTKKMIIIIISQATSMLEKSLAQDETYTDAVCLLAEILGKKQEYDKAIAL